MIHGITPTSFLDWDGQIVTVLFTSRCNFKCPFCHNWGFMENLEKYPEKDWQKIKEYMETHGDFIDGVCITGGEPTLEPGLEKLLREVKNMGLKAKLDTNGTRPEIIKHLVEKDLLDYIAMDFKMPLDERYSRAVAIQPDIEMIKASIDFIRNSGISHEFRTTMVPTIHTKEDIVDIAKYLGKNEYLVLQQFNPTNPWNPELKNVKPFTHEEVIDIAGACEEYVGKLKIRGLKELGELIT
ncbi:MAG: anaerobic ribonucleoside-triphosphate reductase activating protein [Thermoplasmata archaeon]|nr:anaerobic ribonucleoside-triphosphate reductase activating protein [Thermoplasmata archaeon]